MVVYWGVNIEPWATQPPSPHDENFHGCPPTPPTPPIMEDLCHHAANQASQLTQQNGEPWAHDATYHQAVKNFRSGWMKRETWEHCLLDQSISQERVWTCILLRCNLNALFSHTIWSMLPIHCSGGLMIMSMLGRHSHLLLEAIL